LVFPAIGGNISKMNRQDEQDEQDLQRQPPQDSIPSILSNVFFGGGQAGWETRPSDQTGPKFSLKPEIYPAFNPALIRPYPGISDLIRVKRQKFFKRCRSFCKVAFDLFPSLPQISTPEP
jgi:hypothetical protein